MRAGELVNPKRVYRVWMQEGLQGPRRRRKSRRKRGGAVPLQAAYPNQVWTYDFMQDAADGRKMRLLTIVDEFTRESVEITVARSIPAQAGTGQVVCREGRTGVFAQRPWAGICSRRSAGLAEGLRGADPLHRSRQPLAKCLWRKL